MKYFKCDRDHNGVMPGKGPHHGALYCVCGKWFKWLSCCQVSGLGGFSHVQTDIFSGGGR